MQKKKAEMTAYLTEKIKGIVKDEQFKLDAFFFCGCPGGTPNAALKKACEAYLAEQNGETRAHLILELGKAAANQSQVESIGTLMNNQKDIAEVLSYKEYL